MYTDGQTPPWTDIPRQTPPGRCPLPSQTPPADTAPSHQTTTAVDGTYSTEMHLCLTSFLSRFIRRASSNNSSGSSHRPSSVSQEEFIDWIQEQNAERDNSDDDDPLRDAFALLDADKDGFLNKVKYFGSIEFFTEGRSLHA